MVPDHPDNNNDEGEEEDQDGYTIHAMHQKDIGIAGFSKVTFPEEEVLLNLFPDAHKILLF